MTEDKKKDKKTPTEIITDGETVFHPKVWGGEYWIVNKEYCGKKLILNKGYRCSSHHHQIKDETFFIISGKVLMEIGDERKILNVGDKQYIPIGVNHRFTGLEDSEIIEFSTHHMEDDSYRETESEKVPEDEFNKLLTEEWDSYVNISAFKRMNMLVIGDVMLDVYQSGVVERLMPDSPNAIVKITNVDYFLGGMGNLTSNLKSLGGDVTVISAVGKDEHANKVREVLDSKKITGKLYVVDEPTISKINIFGTRPGAESQKMLRIDIEEPIKLSKKMEDEIISYIDGNISKFNALVISDYNKGMCTERVCKEAIKIARKNNIPSIVDPKGKNWDKYSGATIAKPNIAELSAALGKTVDNDNDKQVSECGRELLEKADMDYLLVSRSENGVTLCSKNLFEEFSLLPSSDKVLNVAGVGDTMVAALSLALASKMSIRNAVNVSNIAAGCACAKMEVASIDFDELNYRLALRASDSKIVDVSVIKPLVEFLKKSGEKIVFTNGYYDVINNNHIEHFKQAKALGDVLIVGVNSDISAKNNQIKLFNNEMSRLSFLSNISIIDYLVSFDSSNPNNLLEQIWPDVIVKGGNYKKEEIVGREYAKEAVILPYVSNR
ncbi:MAG: PfkB family carbohydrate kinase [Bdellovibrionota bacterium]